MSRTRFSFARRFACSLVALGASACTADVLDPSLNGEDGEVSLAQQALLAECNGILVDGVFDEYVASSSSSDAYALAKSFCKEVHDTASGGGGGGIDLAVISVKVSGSG